MGQPVTPARLQTPKEYDMSKFHEDFMLAVIGAATMPFIFVFGYYKLQTLLPPVVYTVYLPMQLCESPLFQIHVLGNLNVNRPFSAMNPFEAPPPPAQEVSEEISDAADVFKEGTRVRIHGMQGQNELNGEEGVVVGYDIFKERWLVEVRQQKRLKFPIYRLSFQNLELVQEEIEDKDDEDKKDD
eukprot:gnl/MRDRNA2_/MRDRNA2_204644_c0_seq1.p1 gnl/MRDRNA2_/MRDRNA2_204644_c0~~gnl/MRDRNA2_/MRDRNA2_204644_c0_seq1.p1  ORF type:complete len:201 (+),score=42.07 gnl/MRDRNA2_/MRDRNA2_204644_c0_seq1:49-603(+)